MHIWGEGVSKGAWGNIMFTCHFGNSRRQGVQGKLPSVGEVWIFSGNTHLDNSQKRVSHCIIPSLHVKYVCDENYSIY